MKNNGIGSITTKLLHGTGALWQPAPGSRPPKRPCQVADPDSHPINERNELTLLVDWDALEEMKEFDTSRGAVGSEGMGMPYFQLWQQFLQK